MYRLAIYIQDVWNFHLDLKVNVIVLTASIFVNLKLLSLNKIIFKKILNMSL